MTIHNLQICGINIKSIRAPNSHYNAVFFHGYGANADDLLGLHSILDPDQQYNWYFPEGILQLENSFISNSRAWFPIPFLEGIQDITQKKYNILNFEKNYSECFNAFVSNCNIICTMINNLQISFSNTIVGGFSQGSIVALETALQMQEKYKKSFLGLIIFSGTLFAESYFKNRLQKQFIEPTSIFQTHGLHDTLLPVELAQELYNILTNSKFKNYYGDLYTFSGGHEIPLEALEKSCLFLHRLYKASQ